MKVQLVPQFSGIMAKATAYYGHAPSNDELDEFYRLLTMPSMERDVLLEASTVTVSENQHFAIPSVVWP
jgi:hypothetical protein